MSNDLAALYGSVVAVAERIVNGAEQSDTVKWE